MGDGPGRQRLDAARHGHGPSDAARGPRRPRRPGGRRRPRPCATWSCTRCAGCSRCCGTADRATTAAAARCVALRRGDGRAARARPAGLYHRLGVELADQGIAAAAGQLPAAQRPRRLLPRRRRRRPAGGRQRGRAGRGVGPHLRRRGRRPGGRRPAASSWPASSPSPPSRPGARWPAASAGGRCCSSTATGTRSCPSTPRPSSATWRGRASWWSCPGDGHLLAEVRRHPAGAAARVAARGAGARPARLSRPAHDPGRAPTDRYEVRVSLASTGRRRSEARRSASG